MDNPGTWLTWRTARLLSSVILSVILENCPGCRSDDECDHVSVELDPLKGTILPEPGDHSTVGIKHFHIRFP
ncbi:hypothetical protein EDB89DRAFT_1965552 [Lactarius sanguifluus]|nr:hypothetical protein EDB89DRAFT_1965552 [Lactarius sanguifluus]